MSIRGWSNRWKRVISYMVHLLALWYMMKPMFTIVPWLHLSGLNNRIQVSWCWEIMACLNTLWNFYFLTFLWNIQIHNLPLPCVSRCCRAHYYGCQNLSAERELRVKRLRQAQPGGDGTEGVSVRCWLHGRGGVMTPIQPGGPHGNPHYDGSCRRTLRAAERRWGRDSSAENGGILLTSQKLSACHGARGEHLMI